MQEVGVDATVRLDRSDPRKKNGWKNEPQRKKKEINRKEHKERKEEEIKNNEPRNTLKSAKNKNSFSC